MKKMKKITAGISVAVLSACMAINTLPVCAEGEGGEGGGGGGGAVSTPGNKAQSGLTEVNNGLNATTDLTGSISKILNAVFFIIGIIAVVMIILGGVNYTTSQGDPSKIQKAKNTITYGIIGLVVSLLAFAIINFVLKIF